MDNLEKPEGSFTTTTCDWYNNKLGNDFIEIGKKFFGIKTCTNSHGPRVCHGTSGTPCAHAYAQDSVYDFNII